MYGGKAYVIIFDLLTIENIESATGLGIESLAQQFADDSQRRLSKFGRMIYGCLLREIPELSFETFCANFAHKDFAKCLSDVTTALVESTQAYLGGLAEVEEKKGSTENPSPDMIPGSGIVSAAMSGKTTT